MHESLVLSTDDGLDGATTEQLSISLAKASPEVRKCVASCKHIAETARQQNNFQNVSYTFTSACLPLLTSTFSVNLQLPPTGERGVVPGGTGD